MSNQTKLIMKKLIVSLFAISLLLLNGWSMERVSALTTAKAIITSSASAIDQSAEVTLQTDSTAATADTKDKPFDWKGLIIGLLFLSFYGYAVVWIVITLVTTKKLVPVTKQEYINMRKLANKSETATDEENNKAFDCTEEAFNSWKLISGEGEEELRSPMTMAQIKKSRELHAKAVSYMPTSDGTIDRINEMGGVINVQQERSFSGSWKLIIVAIVATIIVYLMSKNQDESIWRWLKSFWIMPVGIILYYFASLAPAFLISKRERWFKGKNIHNAFIGTIFGLLLAAPATNTMITTWSDGSKTKSNDINPFFIFMMILTFMLILLVGFFIGIFAGLNFIRNYVVYV
jgi:hypothetical protein